MLLAAAGVPASVAAAPAPTTTPLAGVMPLTDAAPAGAEKNRRVRPNLSLKQLRNRLSSNPPRTNKGWQLAKVEKPKVVQGPKAPPPQKLKRPVKRQRRSATASNKSERVNATPVVRSIIRANDRRTNHR